jgi:hypothetical protein
MNPNKNKSLKNLYMQSILKYIVSYIIFLALILASNVLFSQLFISPGSSLTIKNGTSLFVGTDLILKSNSTASGYLVDQTMVSGVEVTGNILIERYLSSGGWHNVSSPLSNSNSSLFTGTDMVFYYDETLINNDWNFGWVWHNGNLSVMRGYDLFVPDAAITAQYLTTIPDQLNSGQYTVGVTLTNVSNGEIASHKGWNLIGNPYPSPVDWLIETAWDKSAINDAKYIWDPVGNVYTIFIGGGSPIGLNGGTQFIPAGQGFWIQAVQNGNVSINNSARVGITPSTPDFYKTEEFDYPVIIISARGNGFKDETILRFIEGSTEYFDLNKDAFKLFSTKPEVPQIASKQADDYLAINSLGEISEGLTVPLYFKNGSNGIYTISITPSTSYSSRIPYYLKDSKDGTFNPIYKDSSYVFNYSSNDSDTRFSIVFSSDLPLILQTDAQFRVITNGDRITIENISGKNVMADYIICNLAGQCVSAGHLNQSTSTSIESRLPVATYILEVFSRDFSSKHKITILYNNY